VEQDVHCHAPIYLINRLQQDLRVAQWLALVPHSARVLGSIPALGDCVEFAHSLCVFVGFLQVLQFPPTVQKCEWQVDCPCEIFL